MEVPMMKAFLSYAHIDDDYSGGFITLLRRRLTQAVRVLTGSASFYIFQDPDIGRGEEWRVRVNRELDASDLFIPVLTPSFFASKQCREEADRFLRRENLEGQIGRTWPIYYIECEVLEDEGLRRCDSLATRLQGRQWDDWRSLRGKPLDDPEVTRRVESFAADIKKALAGRRVGPARPRAEPRGPNAGTAAHEVLEVQEKVKSVFMAIRSTLNEVDPAGVWTITQLEDEYDSEVRDIMRLLPRVFAKDIALEAAVEEVFDHSFSPGYAPSEKCAAVSRELRAHLSGLVGADALEAIDLASGLHPYLFNRST